MDLTITIPNDKVGRVRDAFVGLYPIPMIPDPNWVDPEDNSTAPLVPQFTESEWGKEVLCRFIIQQVHRWEVHLARQQVQVNVPADESIAS